MILLSAKNISKTFMERQLMKGIKSELSELMVPESLLFSVYLQAQKSLTKEKSSGAAALEYLICPRSQNLMLMAQF